jgi:hypothetical protein
MSRFLAGWAFAAVLMGNLWMVLAPIVSRTTPLEPQQGVCPHVVVQHGVGSDLKTYRRAFDACGGPR